jgi:hypothetical protein
MAREDFDMPTVQPAHSTHKRERDLLSTTVDFVEVADRRRRNQFVKSHEVAAQLGMSIWTLKGLWAEGKGPRLRILSPRVKGSTIGDIEDFLDHSIVT